MIFISERLSFDFFKNKIYEIEFCLNNQIFYCNINSEYYKWFCKKLSIEEGKLVEKYIKNFMFY